MPEDKQSEMQEHAEALQEEPAQREATLTEDGGGDEPQAGPVEIAAAVFVFLVMVGGVVYSWYQGLQTGLEEGRDQVLAETGAGRMTPLTGTVPLMGIRLQEDQRIVVIVEGPGDETQRKELEAGADDRVVIAVDRGGAGRPVLAP